MQQTCAASNEPFLINEAELQFLERIGPVFSGRKFPVPPPSLCPAERQRRRLAFRNERAYYRRRCSMTGRPIISIYPEDVPFPVFSAESFWGDDWNAADYGREFDFSRSFFAQFSELQNCVPRLYFSSTSSDNSEYCNHVANMKDCYLIIGSLNSELCCYGARVNFSRECIDCLFINNCELCYECVNCENCYDTAFAFDCKDVSASRWVRHCRSSTELLFCTNVRQGKHVVLNEQRTSSDYFSLKERLLSDKELQDSYLQRYRKLLLDSPVPAVIAHCCEDCRGNYLTESRNLDWVFDAHRCENVRYGCDLAGVRDCMDVYSFYDAELCYDSYSGSMGMFHCLFIRDCWPGQELLYCDHCFGCSRCFGCIGLRNAQHCVLNKSYTRHEYEKLAAKLLDLMQSTGEWGEFFPVSSSPFPYNDTAAQEYYPLSESAALALGYCWRKSQQGDISDEALDGTLVEQGLVSEKEVLSKPIRCKVSGRLFRLTRQELAFYAKQRLSLPGIHPDERHFARKRQKNSWNLWLRRCAKTGKEIWSGYPPESPENVYSLEAFAQFVHGAD